MTSARRLIAAVSLAAGAAALATPTAHAAGDALGPGNISVQGTINDLQTAGMPEEHRALVPKIDQQLGGLSELNKLQALVEPVAPLMNLVPAIA
ncbi:hypothetical protein DMA15_19830 [Streptomyces sp. WAC 01529]|uniref:hypothetical protein n=1 Tax=Streptomyces sp. WAC 01529 TaxID=2203205 RepID=UPI000F6F8E2F|nr:hypothetical protein [Streptomyces sp. WAC 01529]AZM54534.1 hypothetical protein DMA15_19830 [Streptomyces sp. WAC 01529]